jgi:hypothetical protein
MKLLRASLGRPIPRLYFKVEEWTSSASRSSGNSWIAIRTAFRLPVPTDDIIRMIEKEADDLDMYTDLPEELDGYTDFFSDRKPRVLTAKRFSDPRYEIGSA